MNTLKKVLMLGLVFAVLVACTQPVQPNSEGNNQSTDSDVLTIAIFGGEWGDAIKESIVKPFEEKHGVTVNIVEGTSTITLSKLKQEQNAPTIDVALMDSGISEMSFEDGLVEELDESQLSNASDLIPRGIQKSGETPYAVALGYWGLGLTYNSNEIDTAPTSWNDLWKEEYAGKVTIPNPETTGGLPFVLRMAELNGGSADDIDKGFAKIKELNTAAYFNGSGAASNLYQTGEVNIGAHYGGPVWVMNNEGLPLEFVIPEEGVLAAGSYWHLVKNAPNKELALKFLDEAITPESQKGIADSLYLAPVNEKVELSPETAEKMPFGKDGSIDDLHFPDYDLINEHREEWNNKWNQEIGQ